MQPPHVEKHVASKSPVGDISAVTLVRTDTTLDHSQKAEKVCVARRQLQLRGNWHLMRVLIILCTGEQTSSRLLDVRHYDQDMCGVSW